MSKNLFFICLGGLGVECKARFLKVRGSNHIIFPYESLLKTLSHNNPSLPLQLHQIAKKSKKTFAFPSVSEFFYAFRMISEMSTLFKDKTQYG